MRHPRIKCFEDRWDNGNCPDVKNCSYFESCAQDHWRKCYKKNFAKAVKLSEKCIDCELQEHCYTERDNRKAQTRKAMEWLMYINALQNRPQYANLSESVQLRVK